MNLRRALPLINMLIVGLIVWQAADIALTWRSGRQTASVQVSPNAPPGESALLKTRQRSLGEFQSLISNNIFKTTESASVNLPRPETAKEIEVTKLDLKLKGTVLGENQPSYAVIQGGKVGRESLFYLNDTVEGAQIMRILADRVILQINGKEEALIMSAESGPSQVRPSLSRALPRRPVVRGRPLTRLNPVAKPPDLPAVEGPEPGEPADQGGQEDEG